VLPQAHEHAVLYIQRKGAIQLAVLGQVGHTQARRPGDARMPLRGYQTGQAFEQGAFAGSVGANDGGQRPLCEVATHLTQGPGVVVAHAEVLHRQCGQRRQAPGHCTQAGHSGAASWQAHNTPSHSRASRGRVKSTRFQADKASQLRRL